MVSYSFLFLRGCAGFWRCLKTKLGLVLLKKERECILTFLIWLCFALWLLGVAVIFVLRSPWPLFVAYAVGMGRFYLFPKMLVMSRGALRFSGWAQLCSIDLFLF